MKRSFNPVSSYQAPSQRTMARFATVLCVAASLHFSVTPPAMAASGTETGVWIDDTGRGAVEIAPCGAKLCGRIFWLQEPLDKNGKPMVDLYNPEPKKRGQLICGLQVLGGLQRQSDGAWDAGWVYDPKVGEAYDVAIEVKGSTQLIVTGYKGMKLFGKKLVWTRAPADKQPAKCIVPSASPQPKT